MKKTTRPFGKPTTHVFFFCLFLVLLSWPLLTVPDLDSPAHTMAVYLFALWLTMIGVLFVAGTTSRKDLGTNSEEDQELDAH